MPAKPVYHKIEKEDDSPVEFWLVNLVDNERIGFNADDLERYADIYKKNPRKYQIIAMEKGEEIILNKKGKIKALIDRHKKKSLKKIGQVVEAAQENLGFAEITKDLDETVEAITEKLFNAYLFKRKIKYVKI